MSLESWFVFAVVVLIVFFVVGIVVVSGKRKIIPEHQRKMYLRVWNDIQHMSAKEAILEADKILDKLLSHKGYQGSLGEKLKSANGVFSDIDAVWNAHKLRNKLAHELNFHVSPDVLKKSLKSFERAYRDLGLFS